MKFRGRREPPPFSVEAGLAQGEQNVPATSVEGSAQRAGETVFGCNRCRPYV